jgi:hypothetical protein
MMIELYDDDGRKVAEIRGKRLVSMEGDCLATLCWEPDEEPRARCHADMAQREARFEDGWLLDTHGVALACATPTGRGRRWHEATLADWAYGREPEPR